MILTVEAATCKYGPRTKTIPTEQPRYGVDPMPHPSLRIRVSLDQRVAKGEGGKGGPGPLMLGTTKTSVFSTNAQSRFMSVVLDGILGPPRLAWHPLQFP